MSVEVFTAAASTWAAPRRSGRRFGARCASNCKGGLERLHFKETDLHLHRPCSDSAASWRPGLALEDGPRVPLRSGSVYGVSPGVLPRHHLLQNPPHGTTLQYHKAWRAGDTEHIFARDDYNRSSHTPSARGRSTSGSSSPRLFSPATFSLPDLPALQPARQRRQPGRAGGTKYAFCHAAAATARELRPPIAAGVRAAHRRLVFSPQRVLLADIPGEHLARRRRGWSAEGMRASGTSTRATT